MKFFGAYSFIFLLLFACKNPPANQQAGEKQLTTDTVLQNGKKLFLGKCASCHMINKELTGPALKGVENRWPDTLKLYAFIRNSQLVIQEDAYAHELWLQFNQTIMNPQPDLTDKDIRSILDYIAFASASPIP